MSEIGDKIKQIRESQGLKLIELAEMAEIDHSTLSKIEAGINNPNKRNKVRIAKALKNNLGDPELDQYLNEEDALSKKEIIKETAVEEIFDLKFGGKKSTKRSTEELIRLKKLVDRKIEGMLGKNE